MAEGNGRDRTGHGIGRRGGKGGRGGKGRSRVTAPKLQFLALPLIGTPTRATPSS